MESIRQYSEPLTQRSSVHLGLFIFAVVQSHKSVRLRFLLLEVGNKRQVEPRLFSLITTCDENPGRLCRLLMKEQYALALEIDMEHQVRRSEPESTVVILKGCSWIRLVIEDGNKVIPVPKSSVRRFLDPIARKWVYEISIGGIHFQMKCEISEDRKWWKQTVDVKSVHAESDPLLFGVTPYVHLL